MSAEVAPFSNVIPSSLSPPVIVGITMEPGTRPPRFVTKCLARAEYVKRFLSRFHRAFILVARSVLAYFVSKLDAVVRGSYLP